MEKSVRTAEQIARLSKAANLKFACDLGPNVTLRDYLRQLLRAVWEEEEGFSGKRPFGNSGWMWDVYNALVQAKLIEGTFSDGEIIGNFDIAAARAFVLEVIDYCMEV